MRQAKEKQLAQQQAAEAPAPDTPITRAAQARAAAVDNWQGFNIETSSEDEAPAPAAAPPRPDHLPPQLLHPRI